VRPRHHIDNQQRPEKQRHVGHTPRSALLEMAIILGKRHRHVLAIPAKRNNMIGTLNQSISQNFHFMPKRQLDAYDRRILEALQQNGRLTN
ncbi:winged helix-turn-helix transcriptional regulator, partial [Klebsiella pneumoniae]|uniref:winged helix-turn-helix transcriptional regulator n=1 Tax=Klebsiella pneumoniae TaxID=573 RepID=UPI003B5A0AD4